MNIEKSKEIKNPLNIKIVSAFTTNGADSEHQDIGDSFLIRPSYPKNMLDIISFCIPYVSVDFDASLADNQCGFSKITVIDEDFLIERQLNIDAGLLQVPYAGATHLDIYDLDLTKLVQGLTNPWIRFYALDYLIEADKRIVNIVKMELIYTSKDTPK